VVGSDGQLLMRAREGDLAAFEAFVRSTERRVRAVLARLLDDERDIDEVAQDTYVQVWRNLPNFRGDAAATTWLHRIAVNAALQRLRRKVLPTAPIDDVAQVDLGQARNAAADVVAGHRQMNTFIAATLRAMPVEYRAPVVLRDVEGWTTEEVAAALDLTVAAVKSRVHRGRMHLRVAIERFQSEA
jgi:RNA polymerase sigma-70 factor (ECF subfamily)